jgi:hypothetical protein
VSALPLIDRQNCRAVFERRFTVERMVRDYLNLYERVAGAPLRPRLPSPTRATNHVRAGVVRTLAPQTDVA